jgi:alcohol dehydrogenase (quinone), cytochrome c subunit
MRRAIAIALLAVCPAALSSGCGESAMAERARLGEETYVRECARCHMTDGRGVRGVYPNLADNPIVTLESPEAAIETVVEGRDAMPAFGGVMPAQRIAAVVTYVRRAWGNDASSVTAAQVK